MKELSIEGKATRYDAAIESLRAAFYDNNSRMCEEYRDAVLKIIEPIFPELKESEDERIKRKIKEVIDICLNIRPQIIAEVDYLQIKKWLEKQGKNNMGILEATKKKLEDNLNKALEKETPESWNEFLNKQKPTDKVEPKFKIGDTIIAKQETCMEHEPFHIDKIEDDCYWDGENTILVCNQDEFEVFEQKHADKAEPKFKVGDIIKPKDRGHEPWQIMQVDILDKKYRFKDGYVIHFSQEDNYELVEQKPAWSEEDETTKNNISHIIRQYDKISKRENKPCWYIGDCLLWMQNIKDRVHQQPKSEWSEEDNELLDEVDYILTCIRNMVYNKELESENISKLPKDYDILIDRLKSLRPQLQWKPSEKEMEALEVAIEHCDKAHFVNTNPLLIALYKDLKKLK